MATALRLRRGTTTQHGSFTGAEGEVTVDTTKDTVVVHDGSTAGGFPLAKETGSTVAVANGTVSAPGLTTSGDTNTGIFFPAADTIAFAEGGVEAMRINSSANVGIGTTSPAGILHTKTAGGEGLRVQGTATAAFIRYTDVSDVSTGYIGQNTEFDINNQSNTTMRFYTNNAVRMVLNNSGPTLTIGNGETSGSPSAGTLRAAGGSGTDIAGASLTIQGGRGTGTGAGGPIVFSTSAAGSSGSSLNAASERMRIDSSGNVGIGTSALNFASGGGLIVYNNGGQARLILRNDLTGSASTDGFQIIQQGSESGNTNVNFQQAENSAMLFSTNATERMRINSSGSVGIGTSSPNATLHVQGSGTTDGSIVFNQQLTATTAYNSSPQSGSMVSLKYNTGGDFAGMGGWSIIKENGTDGNFAGAMLFHTRANGGAITERARITSGGDLLVGQNSTSAPGEDNTTRGASITAGGKAFFSNTSDNPVNVNRNTNDGVLISLRQDGVQEGSISVSGNTVSYNAFAGSHWSQLSDGSKPEILRGTVMESINELVEWPGEPTSERLCRVKISDTAGSKKVYGVFMCWDEDWTATNDMLVTSVGAFICRVNGSVTVQEGDLLESNGDGTARVQTDDIIRSSTIGKVTCTTKTYEYADGSYCVPTVLYCG